MLFQDQFFTPGKATKFSLMNKSRALIIDDEPDICELLEITLSRMKIDCLSAKDLTIAKKLLKENHFDICLTDMRLPDGDEKSKCR